MLVWYKVRIQHINFMLPTSGAGIFTDFFMVNKNYDYLE